MNRKKIVQGFGLLAILSLSFTQVITASEVKTLDNKLLQICKASGVLKDKESVQNFDSLTDKELEHLNFDSNHRDGAYTKRKNNNLLYSNGSKDPFIENSILHLSRHLDPDRSGEELLTGHVHTYLKNTNLNQYLAIIDDIWQAIVKNNLNLTKSNSTADFSVAVSSQRNTQINISSRIVAPILKKHNTEVFARWSQDGVLQTELAVNKLDSQFVIIVKKVDGDPKKLSLCTSYVSLSEKERNDKQEAIIRPEIIQSIQKMNQAIRKIDEIKLDPPPKEKFYKTRTDKNVDASIDLYESLMSIRKNLVLKREEWKLALDRLSTITNEIQKADETDLNNLHKERSNLLTKLLEVNCLTIRMQFDENHLNGKIKLFQEAYKEALYAHDTQQNRVKTPEKDIFEDDDLGLGIL